jgi:hypothetical protein
VEALPVTPFGPKLPSDSEGIPAVLLQPGHHVLELLLL